MPPDFSKHLQQLVASHAAAGKQPAQLPVPAAGIGHHRKHSVLHRHKFILHLRGFLLCLLQHSDQRRRCIPPHCPCPGAADARLPLQQCFRTLQQLGYGYIHLLQQTRQKTLMLLEQRLEQMEIVNLLMPGGGCQRLRCGNRLLQLLC
ncbi:hypothetical protein D3C75_990420 [compost metagenome]